MANKISFVTGETYTLAELFSEERRVIIPDLQRDYCWGDITNKKGNDEVGELVTDFINNLIEQYEANDRERMNLGLFYGYETPANHIQLCDGQQRLTTLFLLLGMLNKRTGKFRNHLISDYEYRHDDKEPYLNYSIRETSLYFLSDLVCRFFIQNTDAVKAIPESDWYFADYDLDPSIRSIIEALGKIEKILADRTNEWLLSFGDWVLNKLTFLYFDMKNRKNGEETFVVINTTGEPLSATQNLKPLVIKEKNDTFDNTVFVAKTKDGLMLSVDKCWEEIETWFWRKRCGDNDTADAGFAEFLRWVYIIEKHTEELPKEEQKSGTKYLIQNILQCNGKTKFPYREIPFGKIHNYWKAVVWIFEDNNLFDFNESHLSPAINKEANKRKAIGQNDCFVLLPVLKYVQSRINTIGTNAGEQRNTLRLYKFFDNLIQIGNVSSAVNSLVGEALKIVDLLDNGDIVSILQHKDSISKQLLTEEEVSKLDILSKSDNREEVETKFWEMQRHPVWKGEIFTLIKMASDDAQQFSFELFEAYCNVFNKTVAEEMRHEAQADLLRRCMIVAADSYKPLYRGAYATFGWTWDDWKTIFSKNIEESRMFFDYIRKSINEKEINTLLNDYIEEHAKAEKEYYEFAIDNHLLGFTKYASCCDMRYDLKDWQICTSGGIGRHTSFFSRRNAYILREYGANYKHNSHDSMHKIVDTEWGVWYWSNFSRTNCVVFESANMKLDTRYLSDEKRYEVVLKALSTDFNITEIALSMGFTMKKDSQTEATRSFPMESFDARTIKEITDNIMISITGYFQSTK